MEYRIWPEYRATAPDVDWKKAEVITAGVDVGVVSTQVAIMCDHRLYCYANVRTSSDIAHNATKAMSYALEGTGMEARNIRYVSATGYGRTGVAFAHIRENELECHARGSRFMFGPTVKTVFDMGGHTAKAIKLYDWGVIKDFAVNDKCAVHMGWGIEMLADLMHVPITEMGERSLAVDNEPEPVSTTCFLYANSEAMGLFRIGATENEVLAAYLFAVAWRLNGLIGRVCPEKEIAFTGGLAKNHGIVKRLERELCITALTSDYDPQLAGAIGAALAYQEGMKR